MILMENNNGNEENFDNLSRLKMELRGFEIDQKELIIYLMENDLTDNDIYNPESNTNKKKIYQSALSVLESIANDPKNMKNYKTDDVSITHFHTNIMRRIDDLRKKISNMMEDDFTSQNDARFTYLFKN